MSITDGICGGFDDKLSGYMSTIDQFKTAMNAPSTLLNDEINNLIGEVASPANDLTDGLNTIENSITGSIPEVPDVTDIEDILKACGLLQNSLLSGAQSAADLVSDFISQITNILTDAISGALNLLGDIIEAAVAFAINAINDVLDFFDLPNLLSGLDALFNCLDAVCGTDVQNDMDYITETLNNLNIDDQGNFDADMAFADLDISTDIKNNVALITDKIAEDSSSSKDALDQVAASMSDSFDAIIDANVNTTTPTNSSDPAPEMNSVAQATAAAIVTKANTLQSFFS